MKSQLEELLGVNLVRQKSPTPDKKINFGFLFFSDLRADVSDHDKYQFMRDVVCFGDKNGFSAVYLPERHFSEFGSIYANSAVMASYLIPQTQNIRFRTAGISLPLHHPAEVVEWWAMNDILSGGRVDLGFGSGWNRDDFILNPAGFEQRRALCSERIPIVQKLWRGEAVEFDGPGGDKVSIKVYPRPLQKELNVWLLVTNNEQAFIHAGKNGYNIFTMLAGGTLPQLAAKIALYRHARQQSGLDPNQGIISLMLHTFIHPDVEMVRQAVEKPFKLYLKGALESHVKAAIDAKQDDAEVSDEQKQQILDFAYQRYYKTSALFGTVEDTKLVVDEAIAVGVDEIACLVDFGVDYDQVKQSLTYIEQLTKHYQ